MISIRYLILAILFFNGRAFADDLDKKIQAISMVNLNALDQADTSWITPENRGLVIQQLRAAKKYHILLFLGDEGTEQEWVSRAIHGDKDARNLVMIADRGSAIQYLIPETYSTAPAAPTPAPEPGSDVFYFATPPREDAASLILGIIWRTSDFPEATRAWADDGRNRGPVAVSGVHEWWEHNKEAILAKRYKEATWLPKLPPMPRIMVSSDGWPTPFPEDSKASPSPASGTSPLPTSAPTSNPARPLNAESSPPIPALLSMPTDKSSPWPMVVGVLALLGAGVALFLRQRK
jgi:hypothetical protein